MTRKQELIKKLEESKARSAWQRGVKEYAVEMAETLWDGHVNFLINNLGEFSTPEYRKELKQILLNGARSWSEYSWGGCSLIYNGDIAERLCSPSELKRTKNGERQPNKTEQWLDTQARALSQAESLIYNTLAKYFFN